MRRSGTWRRVSVAANGTSLVAAPSCLWTLLLRNRRAGRGELETGTLFASPAPLIRFFGFHQLFLDAVRRRMEPGRRLGAAHVVPGTDAVLLLWNLHGRETEAERGQPEPWRAEERCVWDLRRFCFPATWRPFHPPKITWNAWKFHPEETWFLPLASRLLSMAPLSAFNSVKWDSFSGVQGERARVSVPDG